MSAASSPCQSSRHRLFQFEQFPLPSMSMPIHSRTLAAECHNNNNNADSNANHWLFHSFSAPCRTHQIGHHFGHAADAENVALFLDDNHKIVPSSMLSMAGGGATRNNAFVRSQSESAALNKLVQLNAQHKPRHFLDEFEIWRNRKGGQTGGQSGTPSGGPVGSGREVKFFDEPHPLQSDSEGEDSLVSPDEEVSPSASCAEEEEEEEGTSGNAGPMLDVLDELVEQLEGLDMDEHQQQDGVRKSISDHLHQQQHHQSMSPRFSDSLLDASSSSDSSCLSMTVPMPSSMASDCPYSAPSPPPSFVEPPPDYVTVPLLLASVDIAMPAEPSPVVQLPFQVPLLSVELCHRRPSVDGITPPSSATIAIDNAGGGCCFSAHGNTPTTIVANLPEATMLPEAIAASLVMPSRALRLLKRVRFADDCGQCLETVRVMTEPSDYPPKISPAVLRRIRRAAAATASSSIAGGQLPAGSDGQQSNKTSPLAIDEEDSDELEFEGEERQRKEQHRRTWKMAFKQPASEYVRFRDTLDRQRVALENVMLKNELRRMIGTIKVANIAFEKRVFIRHTANGWKTFEDVQAKWQCSPSKAFDTFRFDVPLLRNENPFSRVEFCVCFVAGSSSCEEAHWDSNEGKNFVLVSHDQYPTTTTATLTPKTTPAGSIQMTKSRTSSSGSPPKDINHNNTAATMAGHQTSRSLPRKIDRCSGGDRDDPYRMDWNSPNGWSSTTFGAWKQLTTDVPYW
uniref:CBM21 domain-containing protein n=1 Tax=Globodera rostochiensis TaxID=31243 RepID=A0A914HF10_GLORO